MIRTATLVLLAAACGVATFAQTAERTQAGNQQGQQAAVNDGEKQLHSNPAAQAKELCRRGAKFLVSAQGSDGGWSTERTIGVTCIVLRALAEEPSVGPNHPAVQRGVEFVRKARRDDGGYYAAEGLLKNYESSVALAMFSSLGKEKYADEIASLQKFLTKNQWDEGEEKSPSDAWYGGAGYGHHERPDLSNTQMMLEALHDSGLPKDDPTYKKALVFISRCQMRGESNDQPFAKGSTQGGFIYTCANNGESKTESIDVNGRSELQAYGSMTYAGLKSMIYAGLTDSDPRVQAALDWVRAHWTLDLNPNMPKGKEREGLYYYYHTLARAFEAYGKPTVADKSGEAHEWRAELTEKLGRLQRPDGSWINEADRWMEGDPSLVTAYSMLALQATMSPAAQEKGAAHESQ